MKTLQEFIKSELNIDYTGDSYITVNNEFQDKIYEGITKSYSAEHLVKKIKEQFKIENSKIIISSYNCDSKNFKIDYKTYKSIICQNIENFNELLFQYGYYITNIHDGYINIEPIFSENVTDIVQDDCNGKVYKIITKELVELIHKRNGLITDRDSVFNILKTNYKESNYKNYNKNTKKKINKIINKQENIPFRLNHNNLRNWTSRFYFFAAKNIKGLYKAIDIINSQLRISEMEWRILEIDISNYNVNCYRDCYSEINDNDYILLYINAFFPEKLMKIYNKDEFLQLYQIS